MTLPCEGCILIPLCKHKPYSILFNHCDLLRDYIPYHKMTELRDEDKIKLLDSTLQSTKWVYNGFYIDGFQSTLGGGCAAFLSHAPHVWLPFPSTLGAGCSTFVHQETPGLPTIQPHNQCW